MEIGIRKMAGGLRRQLLVQFLIENYIICFLALLAGIYPTLYISSFRPLIIFTATIVTIAGKVYYAALMNPVDCLRYE